MRVAVVGSRSFARLDKVEAFVRALAVDSGEAVTIVSGGARGVDRAAESAARALGLAVEIYLPNYNKYSTRAPLVRNKLIVDNSDRVVAFWDGTSGGTGYTITYARQRGKPVEIVRG